LITAILDQPGLLPLAGGLIREIQLEARQLALEAASEPDRTAAAPSITGDASLPSNAGADDDASDF